MVSQKSKEHELVKKILSGDTDSFELIIRQHQTLVYQLVSFALFPKDQTEQIVQQVFIFCFEHLAEHPQEDSFADWMIAITTKELLNAIGQTKEKQEGLNLYRKDLELKLCSGKFVTDYFKRKKNIENELRQLPRMVQKVFELRYAYAYPLERIATTLEKSITEIETILFQYRQKLGDTLYHQAQL